MDRKALQVEVEDVIRSMPERSTLRDETNENFAWWGRARASVGAWDAIKGREFSSTVDATQGPRAVNSSALIAKCLTMLHEAAHALRLETMGPVSAAIEKGAVFQYFDQLRGILAQATSEVFFVDPYLNAEFVSRYLPQIRAGVGVRLLTRKGLDSLVPAVAAFRAEHGTNIEIRSTGEMHDRFLFVDGAECFFSGASFKDGAVNAPTILMQIVDAFSAMQSIYQAKWIAGQPAG